MGVSLRGVALLVSRMLLPSFVFLTKQIFFFWGGGEAPLAYTPLHLYSDAFYDLPLYGITVVTGSTLNLKSHARLAHLARRIMSLGVALVSH